MSTVSQSLSVDDFVHIRNTNLEITRQERLRCLVEKAAEVFGKTGSIEAVMAVFGEKSKVPFSRIINDYDPNSDKVPEAIDATLRYRTIAAGYLSLLLQNRK